MGAATTITTITIVATMTTATITVAEADLEGTRVASERTGC